jgi:hypothetical protein
MDDRDRTVGSVANPPLPRSLRGVLRRITTANLLGYLHALTRPSAAARRRWGRVAPKSFKVSARSKKGSGMARTGWSDRGESADGWAGHNRTLPDGAVVAPSRCETNQGRPQHTRLGEVLVCYCWGAEFIYQSRAPGAWGGTGFRSHQPPRAGSWRRRLRARTTRQGSRPPHRTCGFSRRPADRSRC